MNVERNIDTEKPYIIQSRSAAISQYNDQATPANSIPPDFHVLFVLIKNFKKNGVLYSTTNTEDQIFNEAVDNFKGCVEAFSNYNVHIVTTKKVITREIEVNRTPFALYNEDIDELKDDSLLQTGLYDSVMVITKECIGGGVTYYAMFEQERYLSGFSHTEILASDADKIGHGYSMSIPHLDTTGYFIHEWLHQLEYYREVLGNIIVPSADGFNDVENSWKTDYYDDIPNVCARYYSSYYRAILACEVTYTKNGVSRKTGIYPKFWYLTARRVFFGQYLLQETNNNYYNFNDNGNLSTTSSLLNNRTYYWNIFFSMLAQTNKVINFALSNALILDYDTYASNRKKTRIGPYDEGGYLFINTSLSNVIRANISTETFSVENYLTSESYERFNVSYWENGFMTVMPAMSQILYMDLLNNIGADDNIVQLYGWTGYVGAQTWQFRFDGTDYKIYPYESAIRSLSYYNNNLRICSSANTNSQTWKVESVANGKFVFDGDYYIKTSSGNYLGYSGTSIIITNTPQAWTLTMNADNYYIISVPGGNNRLDVDNGIDFENNLVKLHTPSGYPSAQSWKLMLQHNGHIQIVSKLCLTRGLKTTSTGSVISSNPTEWILQKI